LSVASRIAASAFAAAAIGAAPDALLGQDSQSPAAARPSTPAAETTVHAAYQRLASATDERPSDEQVALRAVYALALAVGRTDGDAAAALLDATGFQALPLTGELPLDPGRPMSVADFRENIRSRQVFDAAALAAERFEAKSAEEIAGDFPAVSRWMLPRDVAVMVRPAADGSAAWVSRPCCVVVRVRAGKPAIMGGNLLEVLPPSRPAYGAAPR
jgi:hypothetical protein